MESGEWTNEKELPFNSAEYDVAHPALTKAENILVFACNKKGGYGGMDLYASKLVGGAWVALMFLWQHKFITILIPYGNILLM